FRGRGRRRAAGHLRTVATEARRRGRGARAGGPVHRLPPRAVGRGPRPVQPPRTRSDLDVRGLQPNPYSRVILWFAAFAVLGAWAVLRDARFDYRLIALGAILPSLIDAPLGHRALAHTLLFAVGSLAVVMLATINRRPLRRHLIALPIGFFAHLV